MNSTRKTYSTKDLALAGALAQMDAIDSQSVALTIEQQQVRHAAMMQSRADSNARQAKLDIQLRANRISGEIETATTPEMVYPKRRTV